MPNHPSEAAIDCLRSYLDFSVKSHTLPWRNDDCDDIAATIKFLEEISEYGSYGEIREMLS